MNKSTDDRPLWPTCEERGRKHIWTNTDDGGRRCVDCKVYERTPTASGDAEKMADAIVDDWLGDGELWGTPDSFKVLRAAIANALSARVGEWRKIDSLKDGQTALLYNKLWGGSLGPVQIGWREDDHWLFYGEININDVTHPEWQPTHWQPLPSPPPQED